MPGRKRLEQRDPQKAEELLDALSEPRATVKGVAGRTGIPRMTVSDFKDRNRGVIEDSRQRKWEDLVPILKELALLASERAKVSLGGASAKDAAIVMGIATEKGFLVEGRATSNVHVLHEHRHSLGDLGEALGEALNQLRPQHVVEGELDNEATKLTD